MRTLAAASLLLAPLAAGQPEVDDPAPPISIGEVVQAPEGAAFDWEALEGRAVVLEFWATWCGPCIAAIPHMNELVREFEGEPVEFISVSSETAEPVREFLEKREMEAWVAVDDGKKTFDAYGVKGIPRAFLIDAEGVVRGSTHPAALTANHVRELIGGVTPEFGETKRTTAGVDPAASDLGRETPEPLVKFILREYEVEAEGGVLGGGSYGKGAATFDGFMMKSLLEYVYQTPPSRMIVEAEFEGRYTLIAKAPVETNEALTRIIRPSFEAALGIESEREARTVPAYALRALPGAALAVPISDGLGRGYRHGTLNAEITGFGVDRFASCLEVMLATPIINETGLDGDYNIRVNIDRSVPKDERLDAVRGILKDQYSLALEPIETELEVVVITKTEAE